MKSISLLFVVSAAVPIGVEATNPVQKVVELLAELEAKVIKDGESEQKAYEEYVAWCQTGAKDKEWEIKTAKADLAELGATITKANADIENFDARIEELAAAVTANEQDLKAATEIRNAENSEFKKAESELVEALDTIDRAISVLEKKMRGSALMQKQINTRDVKQVLKVLETVIDAASLNSHDKARLVALAQSDSNEDNTEDSDLSYDEDQEPDMSMGAPSPDAYKSHSGSIIDVLEDMKEKAESQLNEVRKSELNAKHNYEMLAQSLGDQLKADNAELADSKTGKADAQETRASAEGDLAVTQKDFSDAEKVLGNMHQDCMAQAQDHEVSVKSRGEEIKALQAAQKMISATTGEAEAKTYSFLQFDGQHHDLHRHSELQTRADLANFEVVNLLRKLAKEQKSTELNQLAARVGAVMRYGTSSGEDPFVKVRGLIQDMIARLEKEAAEEADHKAYCDAEMAKTKKHREELEYDVETIGAKIDKAKTKSAKLKEEVAELSKEIAEITKSQGESDQIRKDEHSAFVQTKADLEEGLNGIRAALKILKEYYAEGQSETVRLESGARQPAAPEMHSKASSAASGVIGMLEVIESDFAKNLAQATTEEDSAAVAYQRDLLENKVSKSMKEKDVKYKTKEAASLDKTVSELSSDHEAAQAELDSLLSYTANLRGMCELKPESYEDRAFRRQAEIKGLREALAILDGEATFLQRLKKPFLKRHTAF
jgi:chromosome segregation ATPase